MSDNTIKEIFKNINIDVECIKKANNSFNSSVYIIYSANEKYIFKTSNNEKKRINESKYYNYLSNYVPTSKVLDSGCVDGIQYNVFTFFNGKNIYDEECNNLSHKQIYNVGELLAKIHSCKIIDEDNDSWLLYLDNCLKKTQEELVKIFGNEDNELIRKFICMYIEKYIKNNYVNSILHMDFRIGNVMFADNNTVGIIDLESMKNGDSVFDFVKMNRIFNQDNFQIFLEGYKSVKQLDSLFYDKLKFYGLFDSYTSLYWCASKDQYDTDFYKLNYSLVLKYLGEIKNGEWNIQ